VFERLSELYAAGRGEEPRVLARLRSDLAYLRALMGERRPLREYIQQTQGCGAAGWPDEYITARGDLAREAVAALGIEWDQSTYEALRGAEHELTVEEAADAIRTAADELEPAVRKATGTDATYALSVETVNVDAYWAYWLDGAGDKARLRLNLRHAQFTDVLARQFALHEVLGHALEAASFSARCASEDVPWVRLLSVHAQQQVLFEGLAQAMPLFVTPDDAPVVARVRLAHYTQLVRAELHLAINDGASVEQCVRHARARGPYWSDEEIADVLSDRAVNPQLRSYLWAYPAGIDWFVCLAEDGGPAIADVLRAAYRDPLTPDDLAALWPAGPAVGGPGSG
jgi:hypothetical protein